MFLQSKIGLPDKVKDFLSSGKPPIYIGFGSNPITNPEKYTAIFEKVLDLTGQRFIISKGWADLQVIDTSEIIFVDEMPFELLFPKLSAVIYHGGTGTLAAIARAGIPQAAFPFMGDQFDNRKRIVELGLSPQTVDFKSMTAESLSSAISACITNDTYKRNALEMAQKLQNINGTEMTIRLIEKELMI